MSRAKLFIENFFIYGLGGIISKMIPIIMMPIITRLMPDSFYFGLNDLTTTVVSFASALALMGMYDAMFRLFFEDDDTKYKRDICSTAFNFILINSTIILIILLLFRRTISEFVFGSADYENLLELAAITIFIGATNGIVSAPTRMENKRKVYILINVFSSIISYLISIPLLINGFFVIALPLSAMITAIVTEIIFLIVNKKWFKLGKINFTYLKEMVRIGLPLVPNFLIYWLFNSCDRLMIAKIMGNEFTGIYALGAKVGSVSQLIYTAFANGWQYFAFSTMRDKDQKEMTSKIFEYLGVISFIATILLSTIIKPFFQILFEGEYEGGYIVVPYLFLSPLLLMLFQTACNQFLIIKKTWPNMIILSSGALINIGLNYILINSMGIEGAAIATLIGYTVSVILIVLVLQKLQLLKISKKFLYSSILIFLFLALWRVTINSGILYIIALVILICEIRIFKKEILEIINTAIGNKSV